MGGGLPSIVFCSAIFFYFCRTSIAETGNSVSPTLPLTDGQTLVSSNSVFELGFFSPGSSQNRYLGIWYKRITKGAVVWVANRATPLRDNHGVLNMSQDGNLVLHSADNIVWHSNFSSKTTQNPVAQLLDTGNLVVKDKANNNNYLWQSFDYPCDRLISGMKLGVNFKTGQNWLLSSWKSSDDPSPGDYTVGFDTHGFPQIVLRKGPSVVYRARSWDGIGFTGDPSTHISTGLQRTFFYNQNEEVNFTFSVYHPSVVSELVLNQWGSVNKRYTRSDGSQEWLSYETMPSDQCDNYGSCGGYGSCDTKSLPVCKCLDGFVGGTPDVWMAQGSRCVRRTALSCGEDGFRKYVDVKLPDTRNAVVNMGMSVGECEDKCLKNCSCTAYAMANLKLRNGCLLWFGVLNDIRKLPFNGQELYLKVAASDLDEGKDGGGSGSNKKKRLEIIITCVLLFLGMLLLGLLILYVRKTKKQKKEDEDDIVEDSKELQLPIVLDFVLISAATNDFSMENKLGQGGFGPVYKGKLQDGREIAVKRLSRYSTQGLNEFKNEVKLISKLQHRNLVKLLGCCHQGEEKMLVYEHMPNKSLDLFLFDETKSCILDWGKRYKIICGIARGLLYLHQDSRLRIIHRDLKVSNILLDNEMNPKISDFGLARTFGGDQSEANTRRVVGTYGYMSPEYAIDGLFSTKSDVFSFGVIVLEIISGKRNRGFQHHDHHLNLLGHAWKLWTEGNPSQLMDATIDNAFTLSQVLRCLHVGLLCAQQSPIDRPSMPSVILMLTSEAATLPQPKEPGFFTDRNPTDTDFLSNQDPSSGNEVSITVLDGR